MIVNFNDFGDKSLKQKITESFEIALKETSETEYWLELVYRKGKFTKEKYEYLKNFCGSIRRKLIASVTTAKANKNEHK